MPTLSELLKLTPERTALLKKRLAQAPEHEQRKIHDMLKQYERVRERETRQCNYIEFVKSMWPAFIDGPHIRIMANAFERIAAGTLNRLIINMPPGFSKSENGSIYFPAWYLGKYPDRRVIQCSHTAEMAVDFGRKVRDKVTDPQYRAVFPRVSLIPDKKASGHWVTHQRGEYFAIGVGGAVAGRRANLLIVDDPHSEQEYAEAQNNPEIYDKVYNWFVAGPLTRLFPDAAVVIIMTRWGKRDLTGQIREAMEHHERPDDWEIIEFPALLYPDGHAAEDDHATSLWPGYWPTDKLLSKKQEITNKPSGVHLWNANYQQNPTSEEGAIIKRAWWRIWPPDTDPPPCEFIIQTWDTAHTKKTRSDFSACTTWGIFKPEPESKPEYRNIILLNALSEKLEFPDLKKRAREQYLHWRPDSLVIEAKSAGWPLIQELRLEGIPVQDYSPSRGEDKFVRLHSIADVFSSGMVWTPAFRWADDVIEQASAFPNGDHDDLVDNVSLAIMRFRQGGFIRLPGDEAEQKRDRRRIAEYY